MHIKSDLSPIRRERLARHSFRSLSARYFLWLAAVCSLLPAFKNHAEDAAELREKGIQALKLSESDSHAIINAARCFAKAAEAYSGAGDEANEVEMNSFLYWCRKKMTVQNIEEFTRGGEVIVADKLNAVETILPKAEETQAWFDRAETFAKNNPNEHFLIAVRFFEVASRFKGSDLSFAAQDRSLKELACAKEKTTAPKPPPQTVDAQVDKPDPVKKRLDAAKEFYAKEVEAARKAALEALNKRETAARKDGNKKTVDQVKAEREAFESAGAKAYPIENRKRLDAAWKPLSAAYESAIKEYTKNAQDAEATLVEKEFDTAKSEWAQSSTSVPANTAVANLKNELAFDLGHGVKLELVLIPAGTFQMGSPKNEEGRGDDEELHTVTISYPFYMGKFTVTQEQYEAVTGRNPSKDKARRNPVEVAAWKDAVEFCTILNERLKESIPSGTKFQLPTEAQWEYACRAGTRTRFYSGNHDSELFEVAWVDKNSAKAAHPVGEKPKNAFGLYDMHGNVWQFCLDAYKEHYETLPAVDPCNAQGNTHVMRGGTYGFNPKDCRAAKRGVFPGSHFLHNGFRIVVGVPTAP